MLRKLFLTTAFFGALCIPAVADEESSNAADSSNVQRNDVVLLSNVSEIVGTSRLFRDKRGVSMDLIATGLSPGAAYTAWWVIFNNPSACINATNTMVSEDQRCDSGDLGNPNVKAGLMWATGQQAGDGGVATFSATLPEGDVSGDRPNPALNAALLDAGEAEIHIVVRTHGAVGSGPGSVLDQLTTFEGGCATCANKMFAAHP